MHRLIALEHTEADKRRDDRENGREQRDQVEGEILGDGHAEQTRIQDGRGVPGHDGAEHGSRALKRAGHDAGIDVHIVERVSERDGGKAEGAGLTRAAKHQHNAGHGQGKHQTADRLDNLAQAVHQAMEHAGALENTGEHTRADAQEDRFRHTEGAAAGEELVHIRIAGCAHKAVDGSGDHIVQGSTLEDHRPDAADDQTSGKDGDGGLAHGGEHQNEQERHQHQHADMAGAEQAVGEDLHGGEVNVARGVAHPQQPIHHDGDERGGNGHEKQGGDVVEQLDAGGRGGQQRGIGQRGELIADQRAGDDRARRHLNGNAETLRDTDQRDAHCARGAPGGTGDDGGDDADDESDRQECLRVDEIHAVVEHGLHAAGGDPHADEHTDEDHHDHSLVDAANALHGGLFQLIPGVTEVDAEETLHADRRRQAEHNAHALENEGQQYRERQQEAEQCQSRGQFFLCFHCNFLLQIECGLSDRFQASSSAIASISHSTPLGSARAARQERAGFWVKYCS